MEGRLGVYVYVRDNTYQDLGIRTYCAPSIDPTPSQGSTTTIDGWSRPKNPPHQPALSPADGAPRLRYYVSPSGPILI